MKENEKKIRLLVLAVVAIIIIITVTLIIVKFCINPNNTLENINDKDTEAIAVNDEILNTSKNDLAEEIVEEDENLNTSKNNLAEYMFFSELNIIGDEGTKYVVREDENLNISEPELDVNIFFSENSLFYAYMSFGNSISGSYEYKDNKFICTITEACGEYSPIQKTTGKIVFEKIDDLTLKILDASDFYKIKITQNIESEWVLTDENKEMSLHPFVKDAIFERKYALHMFTKDAIRSKERIELVNIKDNSDGTVNLIFRKYVLGDIPKLSEEQYDELIKNKKIELLGDIFVLNGNLLSNGKYTTFEIDENKNLKSIDITDFYVGTDDYYITTCDSGLKVIDYTNIIENEEISILDYKLGDDVNLDYISGEYVITEYEFNENNELIKITKSV